MSKQEATRLADALMRSAVTVRPGALEVDLVALMEAHDLLRRWPDGEPVAFALRFAHDKRLNLSTVFDTPEEAQDYVRRCATSIEVVPLYTAPPDQSERIAALIDSNEAKADRIDRLGETAERLNFRIKALEAELARRDQVVAAQPELLDALREAENAIADYVETLEKRGSLMSYGRSVLARVRAAIAKATGGAT